MPLRYGGPTRDVLTRVASVFVLLPLLAVALLLEPDAGKDDRGTAPDDRRCGPIPRVDDMDGGATRRGCC